MHVPAELEEMVFSEKAVQEKLSSVLLIEIKI